MTQPVDNTSEPHPSEPDPDFDGRGHGYWFFAGQRLLLSLPALMLMTAFVGFAGFAREVGLPAWQTMLTTLLVWALPSKFLLVASIQAGFGLFATFVTVSLSAARLMPMVASLQPELRAPKTPTRTLLFLSHFVAITAWVVAMERLRDVPRDYRTTWFVGFAGSLTAANTILVGLVYVLAPSLPEAVLAALFFLTPIYFLCSLWGSARERAGQIAMVAGLLLGPIFHLMVPDASILLTGVTAGLGAFAFHRWKRQRNAKKT
ncbi:MAG: AzlC family ABC transporter permease [Pseudomonadota bacterium]